MQSRSTLFIAFIICATEFVAPCGSVHIRNNPIGVRMVVMSRLSTDSWNWSYPEYKSLMEYIACLAKASANSSTIGPTPEFRIVTLFTGCKSWINRSDPFFFGTVNHRFKYGAFDGSRIPIATFSLSKSMTFGICARGTGIGFRFHGTWSIVKIFGSTHPISLDVNANALPCCSNISRN